MKKLATFVLALGLVACAGPEDPETIVPVTSEVGDETEMVGIYDAEDGLLTLNVDFSGLDIAVLQSGVAHRIDSATASVILEPGYSLGEALDLVVVWPDGSSTELAGLTLRAPSFVHSLDNGDYSSEFPWQDQGTVPGHPGVRVYCNETRCEMVPADAPPPQEE